MSEHDHSHSEHDHPHDEHEHDHPHDENNHNHDDQGHGHGHGEHGHTHGTVNPDLYGNNSLFPEELPTSATPMAIIVLKIWQAYLSCWSSSPAPSPAPSSPF